MKRVIPLVLACVVSLLTLLGASAPRDVVTTAENSTVAIRAHIHAHYLIGDGTIADQWQSNVVVCSGWIRAVHGTYEEIVTARHCAGDRLETVFGAPFAEVDIIPVRVDFFDGDVGIVKSVRPDPNSDVALLKVHSMRRHPAAVMTTQASAVRRGDPLVVFGMPLGHEWSYSSATAMRGTIETSLDDHADPGFVGLIPLECASCDHGDSGAAVWDARGNVVGMDVAGLDSNASGGMVPSWQIIRAVEALRKPPAAPLCANTAHDEFQGSALLAMHLNPNDAAELMLKQYNKVADCEQNAMFEPYDRVERGRVKHALLMIDMLDAVVGIAYFDKKAGRDLDAYRAYAYALAMLAIDVEYALSHHDDYLATSLVDAKAQLADLAAKTHFDEDPNPEP